MADYLIKDRVKDTSTTTGTGNFALSGSAPSGYQSFNTAYGTGTNFYYAIVGGAEWEVGIGNLSAATTLVRATVLASSNAGAAVAFSAGTKDVFSTLPADVIADLLPIESEAVAGTTYTLDATDGGKDKQFTNSSDKAVTVPGTSTLGTTYFGIVTNLNATGLLTITPDTGVTFKGNVWKIAPYKRATILAIGTNDYLIIAQRPEVVITLTDAANVTIDPAKGEKFYLSTASSRTLDAPGAGLFDGQLMTIRIKNTSAGAVTPTFTTGSANAFRFNDTLASASPIAAGKVRYWTAQYNDTDDRWDVLAESGEF